MDREIFEKEKEVFIKKNLFLADEVFCAGMEEEKNRLLFLARGTISYTSLFNDEDLFKTILKTYNKVTRVRA